ncbi:MAG: L-serine ammonia-lyase, iron-sulfur-dependent, subunit alpha [bacterium]
MNNYNNTKNNLYYENAEQLMAVCKRENKRIFEIATLMEMQETGCSKQDLIDYFDTCLKVMEKSSKEAFLNIDNIGESMIKGVTLKQYEYSKKSNTITGEFINYAMALACSSSELNASLGKICACPTAGSCGILPSVLVSLYEKEGNNFSREDILNALITATTIGWIFTKNATVAGAEGGCQAECGVASSMGAAASCYLYGGTDEECLNSAVIAIVNVMGLVCDPVAGLVQIPCIYRNSSGAINALISADMALAGQSIPIPFDEVVQAMYEVGKMLPPQLRETAQGGIANTKTAKQIERDIFNN